MKYKTKPPVRVALILAAALIALAYVQVAINFEDLRIRKDALDAERIKIILEFKSKLPTVEPALPSADDPPKVDFL